MITVHSREGKGNRIYVNERVAKKDSQGKNKYLAMWKLGVVLLIDQIHILTGLITLN